MEARGFEPLGSVLAPPPNPKSGAFSRSATPPVIPITEDVGVPEVMWGNSRVQMHLRALLPPWHTSATLWPVGEPQKLADRPHPYVALPTGR